MPALENLQLGCAVIRICCYTIWRKLCCKKPMAPRPDFSVICLGLTGSGKSTILALLSGESLENVEGPTTGFSIKAVQFKDCILNIKEIGGGEKVRPFWKHYYQGTQAVIFIVNSADSDDNLETARDAMYEALSNPALRGLPCMILGNCQDLPQARNEEQLTEILELTDACSDRPWVLLTAGKDSFDALREDFSRFTCFLTADTADPGQVTMEGKDGVVGVNGDGKY